MAIFGARDFVKDGVDVARHFQGAERVVSSKTVKERVGDGVVVFRRWLKDERGKREVCIKTPPMQEGQAFTYWRTHVCNVLLLQ